MLIVCGYAFLPASLLFSCARQWGALFAPADGPSSEVVIALLVQLAPWLVLYTCADAMLSIFAGAFTGCGRQRLAGRLSLVSYVGVGGPAALLLCFVARFDPRRLTFDSH